MLPRPTAVAARPSLLHEQNQEMDFRTGCRWLSGSQRQRRSALKVFRLERSRRRQKADDKSRCTCRFHYWKQSVSRSGNVSNTSEVKPRSKGKPAPRFKREQWQLLLDEKATKERLEAERESTNPDRDMIESLKAELRSTQAEMKGRPTCQTH